MTSNTPWSVKGIDPRAREAAKDLARRSGLTLGEWLNQRIAEEGGVLLQEGANQVAGQLDALTGRLEAAEQRSTLAVTGVDQTVRGMLARVEMAEREQIAVGARFEGALHETSRLQAAIDNRLRKLEDEAAGPRSAEAMKSLEAALGRVANHLYDGENRTRESLAEMRRDMTGIAGRLGSVEKAQGEAGDDVAARLIERLDQAQTRMDATVRALQHSVELLDERLAAAEGRLDAPPALDIDKKLDAMAADLAQGLQAARVEMTKQLKEASEGGAERLDQALLEMTAHVQSAERRSADALERMGNEVLRVAETLSRRVHGIEIRAAGAISKVGEEVSKVVDTLDARVDKSEHVQAETLEKLGGEIARVTERLADRIGTAERRSAQQVDEVAEKVGRLSERLNQRYEHSASDLADRIRQSEERTARLLEEARERIEKRLAEAPKPEPIPVPAPTRPYVAPTPTAYAEPASFADPFAAPAYEPLYRAPAVEAPVAEAASAPPTLYPDAAPFGQTFAPSGFTSVEPEFDDADIEAAQGFVTPAAPESEADFVDDDYLAAPAAEAFDDAQLDDEPLEEIAAVEALADDDLIAAEAPMEAAEPFSLDDEAMLDEPLLEPEPVEVAAEVPAQALAEPHILSTRELIDQARAAARAASSERDRNKKKTQPSTGGGGIIEENAGLAGVGFGQRRRTSSSNKTAMFATLGGVAAMVGVGGWLIYDNPNMMANTHAAKVDRDAAKGPAAEDIQGSPRAAVVLDPKPIDNAAPVATSSATPAAPSEAANALALYQQGRAKIEAKDFSGLAPLQKAANLGNPQAQFFYGRLYEDGGAGLTKNLVEARRWYERAAAGGERGAMHNVALMYFEGAGGPQNRTIAAQWFRQAAEAGLVDSQYNLGQLYEQGLGVSQNSAEAYKWYLLASRGGAAAQQEQAKQAANRLKVILPADARNTAERIAADVAQRNNAAPTVVQASNVDIVAVQRALNRLGYFKGAQTGGATNDLRVAVQAYQRDQGLTPNGVVDSPTMTRLSPFLR